MENSLWEIITCHTPAVEDALHLVETNSKEVNKLEKQGELFRFPDEDGLSAMNIVQYVCDILLKFPNFDLGIASDLSAGMLVKYGDDDESPLTSGIVYDILLPNLYCVLALDAIGQKCSDENSTNLASLLGFQSGETEYIESSRFLSSVFPAALVKLFGINKGSEKRNSAYKIDTQFPTLLSAILRHARISPLNKEKPTANSIKYANQFYDACIEVIAPNGAWSERSFVEYYLFERIFRLNTRFTLYWAEYNTGQEDRKSDTILSPEVLSDFFFQSPLVLFPRVVQRRESLQGQGKLLRLFYERQANCTNPIKPMQFLHFLIQLSSFWFPQVLGVLRVYMKDHKIMSFNDVDKFFFSGIQNGNDFSSFQKTYIPTTEEFDAYKVASTDGTRTKLQLHRALISRYSKGWKTFTPCFDFPDRTFSLQSLDQWDQKAASKYSKLTDYYAMAEIQQTLGNP